MAQTWFGPVGRKRSCRCTTARLLPTGRWRTPSPSFLIQPIDKVLAHLPALTVQQHADHPIPVAHPGLRDFPDAHPQLDPLLLVAFVPIRRPGQLQNTACVPFAHSIALFEVLHHRAAPRGLHNFFLSTSCNIVLSNVSSATNCFSRVFSSRSCFSCRTWSTSRPMYFAFHR